MQRTHTPKANTTTMCDVNSINSSPAMTMAHSAYPQQHPSEYCYICYYCTLALVTYTFSGEGVWLGLPYSF